MNKSLLTNLIAGALILVGLVSPWYGHVIIETGTFALSGALTNWLAIYMLFERVPLLYGSGIVPARFEEFKHVIKQTIMEQFFTPEQIKRFIDTEEEASERLLDLEPLVRVVDYDRVFDALVVAILQSSVGGMLGMLGGAKALESLREPFTTKLQETLRGISQSETFHAALRKSINQKQLGEDVIVYIERILDQRLNELTPQQVKEIVERIIHEHLGWLVVWGGVFGGLIGLVFSLASGNLKS
ncbi:MAG: DUF445 family protein [Pseudomonadota bacterium]